MDIKNQIALVTGAGSGLGQATARLLAEEGAKVVVLDYNAEAAQKTADEIGAKLIVMGAYEHSKFSQDIFGGVTHDVVRSSNIPVFMSH